MKQGREFLYSFRVTQFCFTHPILKSRLELQNISSLSWSQLCYIYWEHSTRACNTRFELYIGICTMYSVPFSDSDSMLINNHLLVCIMTNLNCYSKWKSSYILLPQVCMFTRKGEGVLYVQHPISHTHHWLSKISKEKSDEFTLVREHLKDAHKIASDQKSSMNGIS